MRLWLGIGSVDEIDRWAEAVISQSMDVDPLVYDILEADRQLKQDLFTEFLRIQHGFEIVSKRGSLYSEEILADLCLMVLQDNLPVPRFCQIVREIDAAYTLPAERDVPIPAGVNELWHACDWCDEGWTLENQPGLAIAIESAWRKILNKQVG